MENTSHIRKVLVAGMVGNVLEWYDFVVYGYLAGIIGKLFFPSNDPTTELIKAFAVFAVGFIARPIGATFFGFLGDKIGRRKALMISIILMAVSTTAIGLLPTYYQVGILAPILLTLLKITQGLSVGGEYTTSVSFVVEHAPKNKRGLFGSIAILGAVFGILLGSASSAFITKILSEEALYSYGWRILFMTGIILGFLGYYVRRNIEETPKFKELKIKKEIDKNPILDLLKNYRGEFLKTFFLSVFQAVGFYTLFVYLAQHLIKFIHLPKSTALTINTVGMIVLALLIPIFGYLSDKFGRKIFILLSTGLTFLFAYPLFVYISSGSVLNAQLGLIIFAVITAGFMAVLPTTLVEIFPTKVRNTGYSLGYNLPFAIFGGTSPLIATLLIKYTNNLASPSIYLMFAAAVAFLSGLLLKESFNKNLK